ncbi:primosomal protein N' [Ligilactobacillus salitolerans]|uniref:Replication restart protein PriA n=1 Tax=Ligilactobacillus salitolerans TaxID=1808352 RepID=A0A401IRG1_9LACO|nr:primosomal protein N' [Ligilactobacillus salitolerans]GBG94120.1 primosomal protein N' [Ligilactobacillus salitolerans]
MQQFAEVIVDVPTQQTDQPYTYEIPPDLVGQIQPGMRVIVPFGTRRVLGFLVRVIEHKPDVSFEIKPIEEVLDLAPVLSDELLQLSDWLAKWTFSFKISCLQAMLPAAMRASYGKKIRLTTTEVSADVKLLFGEKQELPFDTKNLSARAFRTLSKLNRENKAEIVYEVRDRAQSKSITMITGLLTPAQITQEKAKTRINALRLQQLLDFLLDLGSARLSQKDAEVQTGLAASVFTQGQKKGWLKKSQVEEYRDPYSTAEISKTEPQKLKPAQTKAVAEIETEIKKQSEQVFLLQGVTGSGKTEVYLYAIACALAQKKTALMLVPEISLTPQMVHRVRGRFGSNVAVLHSGLSEGEKYDEWRRIERKEATVVVGARSAVFAPLDNIGVIIMDEEHETSYKQESMPEYHARDVAIKRGQWHHCPVVLGSATPSLESRARAQKGVYRWLRLDERINGQPLPAVKLVNMQDELKRAPAVDISGPLLEAIKERIARNEQVVLMLNRRGYSSFIMCRECGFVLKCPNCDISLTMHMDSHSMKCHYCGHEEPIPNICPSCHSKKIRYYGTGTEKVQQELEKLLPDVSILRMDVDTTKRKGAHSRLLQKFGAKEANILLGTQMIAKGLDFPDVTLVGVLNADTALSLPNFRSAERTFQLLTQVSGRAGRADKTGEVLIQTFNPEHYAIQLAKNQNYEQFFGMEMNMRHRGGYPPYFFTIQIVINGTNEAEVAKKIFEVNGQLTQILSQQAVVLGPTPKPIMRVNNRFYYQLVIKYKNEPKLDQFLKELLQNSQQDMRRNLQLTIDRDPVDFI